MNPILELHPAAEQERMYCKMLPSTIREMAGSCGWLCGNFGASGGRFEDALLRLREQQQANMELCGNGYDRTYLGYICVNEVGNLVFPNYICLTKKARKGEKIT